jgi:glutathione S-transferase
MSEAGHKNLPRALEANRTALPALRQATAAFEAALNAELGSEPSAAQRALSLAAVASYSALYTVRAKLLAARRFRRVESLVSQLTALTGALQRTLRSLGLSPRDVADDQDAQPRGTDLDAIEREIHEARRR